MITDLRLQKYAAFAILLFALPLAAQDHPQLPIPCWPGRLSIPTWSTPVPPHPPCLDAIQAQIDSTMSLATVTRLNQEWAAIDAAIEPQYVARLNALSEALDAAMVKYAKRTPCRKRWFRKRPIGCGT